MALCRAHVHSTMDIASVCTPTTKAQATSRHANHEMRFNQTLAIPSKRSHKTYAQLAWSCGTIQAKVTQNNMCGCTARKPHCKAPDPNGFAAMTLSASRRRCKRLSRRPSKLRRGAVKRVEFFSWRSVSSPESHTIATWISQISQNKTLMMTHARKRTCAFSHKHIESTKANNAEVNEVKHRR